jgi:hypothetical protein
MMKLIQFLRSEIFVTTLPYIEYSIRRRIPEVEALALMTRGPSFPLPRDYPEIFISFVLLHYNVLLSSQL